MSALLQALGAVAITAENASSEPHFETSLSEQAKWSTQTITGLFEDHIDPQNVLLNVAQRLPQAKLQSVEQIADQDWERAWLERFEPLKAGDRLWVVPSWLTPPEPDAVNIIIDPGLAFGTGTHATTSLCLNALSKMDLQNKTVVDYGCGSGILGIAALKLGAREAVGTDIDARAHQTSIENSKINNVGNQFSAVEAQHLKGRQFDLVLANILAPTLIELAKELVGLVKQRGQIWLSGITSSQVTAVKKHFSEFSFNAATQDEWVLLTGSHRA